ncbi:MAG: hypothetical protein ABNH00_07780 [Dokdonia sp.]|jgi:hypothetical protein|nr:hypothetical protein [Cytophagaceae bacterium]
MALYRFLSLTTVAQPPNSKWCWAACAQQMIQGLQINSSIGTTQDEILTYYKNHYPPVGVALETWTPSKLPCPSQGQPMTQECNRGIHPKHIIPVFRKMGIDCHPLKKIAQLIDLEFLKTTLSTTDAPIILHKYISDSHHMVLITGYGTKNNCEYLCLSDPVSKEDDHFVPLSSFSIHQVVGAYVCEIDKIDVTQTYLKEDRLDFATPVDLHYTLTKLQREYHIDIRMVEMAKVPTSLIVDKSIDDPLVAGPYLLSNRSLNEFLSSPISDVMLCPSIPTGATYAHDILKRLIQEIQSRDIRDGTLYFEYNKSLGISVLHHLSKENIMSLPLEAPPDASISRSWQPLHQYLQAQTNIQPLHYFD